jgi:hypothetical protein
MRDLSELLQIRVPIRIHIIITEAILQATVVYAEIRHLQDIPLRPDNTDQIPTGVPEAILFLRGVVFKDHQVIRQDHTAVLPQADLHIAEVRNQEVPTLLVLRRAPRQAEGHQVAADLQAGDNLKQ